MTEVPIKKEFAIEAVDEWIGNFSKIREAGYIDPEVLKNALVECGANFPPVEELPTLGMFQNNKRKSDMVKVWGTRRIDEYVKWTEEYFDEYQKRTGKTLPVLGTKYHKKVHVNSGFLAFLGEITALAAEVLDQEKFRKYAHVRIENGWLWQEGKKDERIRIKVPTDIDPKRIASYPPEFPVKAWEKIKTLK